MTIVRVKLNRNQLDKVRSGVRISTKNIGAANGIFVDVEDAVAQKLAEAGRTGKTILLKGDALLPDEVGEEVSGTGMKSFFRKLTKGLEKGKKYVPRPLAKEGAMLGAVAVARLTGMPEKQLVTLAGNATDAVYDTDLSKKNALGSLGANMGVNTLRSAVRGDFDDGPGTAGTGTAVTGRIHPIVMKGGSLKRLKKELKVATKRTVGTVRNLANEAAEIPPGHVEHVAKAVVNAGLDELQGMGVASNNMLGWVNPADGFRPTYVDEYYNPLAFKGQTKLQNGTIMKVGTGIIPIGGRGMVPI